METFGGITHLVPPLFKRGKNEDFTRSQGLLNVKMSPLDDTVAVYAALNGDPQGSRPRDATTSDIYFAKGHIAPASERRVFIVDTSVIFSAMQNLKRHIPSKGVEIQRDHTVMSALHKLSCDYILFCKECCLHCVQPAPLEATQLDAEHYRKLYSCWDLFSVLYTPEQNDIPMGDDLMEWLNTHYVEPTSEEGDHLSNLDRPWEDEAFWPYLTRAIMRGLAKASTFFLEVLSKHSSRHLANFAQQLKTLVEEHPRLNQFSAERDFSVKSWKWRDQIKALQLELATVPDEERQDEFENWWDRFSGIVGVLAGHVDMSIKVCREVGADWREMCALWCIYVNPTLRRLDFTRIATTILDEMPADPTNSEDLIHSALFLCDGKEAISEALRMDVWLAVHLADMLEPLDIIDKEQDDAGLTLRDHCVLAYVDYMRSDPTLWRHIVDYLYTCGGIGEGMADEMLMRVPLRLQPPRGGTATEEESARIRAGTLAGVLKEVSAACAEHGREATRRAICRIAAQTFMQEKDYALAVSYYASAEDWPGLGRAVNRILDEYVASGKERFGSLVARIAPSLQALRANDSANAVFVYRLMFAVRFAQFHQNYARGSLKAAANDVVSMFREDLVPKSWWAVVLSDAIDLLMNLDLMLFTSEDATMLLHRLEEITIRSAQGFSDDYLSVLAKAIKKNSGELHALQRLQVVQLALTRYHARCATMRVGGKTIMTAFP